MWPRAWHTRGMQYMEATSGGSCKGQAYVTPQPRPSKFFQSPEDLTKTITNINVGVNINDS